MYKVTMRGMTLQVPRPSLMPRPLISLSKLYRFRAALRQRPELRVVHGHFDMSLARHVTRPASFVTLLRDPVERAISHYYHFRKRTEDRIHPLAMQSSLAEWGERCALVEMDNGQTRRLAGEMALPVGQVNERTLGKAMANLEKFAAVGVSERFDEFQILLNRHFGWPCFRYAERNVGANRIRRHEVGEEMLARLEACNRFDLRLYRFATELFESAIADLDMPAELARLAVAPEAVPVERRKEDNPLRQAPVSWFKSWLAGTG